MLTWKNSNYFAVIVKSSLFAVLFFMSGLSVQPANAQSTGGLVAAYNFDEGSGYTLTDRSGSGNHGTISYATWNKTGKYNGSLSFNGLYSLVTIKDSPSLDLTTGLTLAAWVYPTSTLNSWPTIILKEQTGDLAYSLYANSDLNKPSGAIFTTSEILARGANLLPLNTWTHLALTYDGSYMRFYVNAVLTGSIPKTGPIATSTFPLRIGGNKLWSNEYFKGYIDDVRIYNRALSAEEIKAIMNTPIPSDPIPPTVSITAPASASTVTGTSVTVSANAADNIGVAGVQFKLDGVNLGSEDTTSPYSIIFDSTPMTNGPHVLTATARDTGGNTTNSANVTVTISNTTTPPPSTSNTQVNMATPAAYTAQAGSQVTVTLNWDRVPMTQGNLLQFMHLDNGTSFVSVDDHTVSSATWSGSAADARTITIPATLAAGTYDIRVGLSGGSPWTNYPLDRKSTRLNSSHSDRSRMPSSA